MGRHHRRRRRGLRALVAVVALAALGVAPSAARAQGNFEIQVYGSELTAPDQTMVELHSNTAVKGTTRTDNGVVRTQGAAHETLEVGVISPEPKPTDGLGVGEVGYLITGVKDVRQARVGDTVTSSAKRATEALAGYRHPRPASKLGIHAVDRDPRRSPGERSE